MCKEIVQVRHSGCNEMIQVRHSGQDMVCPGARLLLGQGPTVSLRNTGNPAPPADPGALPQLFIVLGNDRANRFWAARLPASEAITPDSGAEQRRDFIARKYREGRYRLPHPHHATQEEVLQVGDTSRCWQPPQSSWSEVPAPPACAHSPVPGRFGEVVPWFGCLGAAPGGSWDL